MARIDTPVASDDEFDLVYDGELSSDVEPEDQHEHGKKVSASTTAHYPNAERLSGPHEVPTLPHVNHREDDLAAITHYLSDHHLDADDGATPRGATTTSSAPSLRRGSSGMISRGTTKGNSFVNDGLQYTKSMYNKLWGKDALIAVMGMTGSGKTTFISKVSGRNDLKIGHDLTSCTRDIQVVEAKLKNGQTIHLVDTPGFSDTNLSDTEVLEMIADYLAAAYKQEMKLSGIIYLHPISDNRVTHHTTKNLEMFRKLTGEKNLKNVVLATTMWDSVTPDEGQRREDELKSRFWKLLLAMGAKTVRHTSSTPESATHIASMLLGNKPFYLQLQEEMGKDNKALRDTAAGREVMLEIVRMKEEHSRELAEMEKMIQSSARESESVIEALRDHYQSQLAELNRTLRDERRMNEAAVRSLKDRIQALEDRGIGCSVM